MLPCQLTSCHAFFSLLTNGAANQTGKSERMWYADNTTTTPHLNPFSIPLRTFPTFYLVGQSSIIAESGFPLLCKSNARSKVSCLHWLNSDPSAKCLNLNWHCIFDQPGQFILKILSDLSLLLLLSPYITLKHQHIWYYSHLTRTYLVIRVDTL